MPNRLFVVCAFLFSVSRVFAANLAVIDSGVDYKHKNLVQNIWTNPNAQTTVEGGTVYKNDTHGWNFAENNNQVIDYKHLGTFSDDCFKIFEVQAKILKGTNTPEEKSWYEAKKKDQQFLPELAKFGNFVHGTHVSGISASNADQSHVIALKLIPTEVPGSAEIAREMMDQGVSTDAGDPFVELMLGMLAKRQAELLITTGKYTNAVKADVANGSFGTSVNAVKPVIKQLLEGFGKEATEEELTAYAISFVNQMTAASKDFVGSAKNTLFVFAAGNDGTNNDSLPCSPANLKADNSITVAATLGTDSLATFSNFGAKNVEVAAPGVAIISTIPGDMTLPMSGTSMAAPFVTNVAGLVKDANNRLAPKDIKKVLMETVDVKSFLAGKVATSGIVNRERAVKAASLSRSMSLDKAIAQANRLVADMPTSMFDTKAQADVLVVPLPSLF